MKTLLIVVTSLLAASAMAQSAPVMGTAPAQPAATQAALVPEAEPRKKAKPVSQITPRPAKPTAPALPLPSQVTKDFYEAFTHGNLQLAEMLFQQGADINCRNCGENTPLVLATINGAYQNNLTGIQWLLAHGANVNLFNSDEKTNPLIVAATSKWARRETSLFLLRNGANPKLKNILGDSAFLLLQPQFTTVDSYGYWMPVFSALLEAGADINEVNSVGYSSLMLILSQAISWDRSCAPTFVKAYLDHSANVEVRATDGVTVADLAYKGALAGVKSCNEVYGALKSFRPATAINSVSGSQSDTSTSGLNGEWQGVFNATAPRQGSASVTSVFSRSGEVIFSSQSGLRGSGRLNVAGNQVDGSFIAKSPLDAQGKPVFANPDGSTDILFTLSASLANGIMRGKYTSLIESGNFVMCDDANYKQNPECRVAQANAASLAKAFSGLLGALKGLSGK